MAKEHLRVIKNPTTSSVIRVNKSDIIEMKEKYPSISIGNHDDEYLKDFKDTDIVGVIAGDLSHINDKNADLWFVNIAYFNKHYTIIKD